MKAAVVTISDGCYHEKRSDESGRTLKQLLADNGWSVSANRVVPDEIEGIREALKDLTKTGETDLIVTTGGTGVGPLDVTPEAVAPLLEKSLPGLGELMRLRGLEKTPFAALSRSLAGSLGRTLILCLPGSPKGATESLQAVLDILPHAVDLVQGRTGHGKS